MRPLWTLQSPWLSLPFFSLIAGSKHHTFQSKNAGFGMKEKYNNVIEVRELTKKFGRVAAVNGISFSVYKGEIFGFLGPNGAGKTTTIRMLTGLLTPDSGDVFIDGVDMKTNPVKAKTKMGVIPEMGNIYADLTAKENILLSGRFYGISRKNIGNNADRLLEQFELYDRRNELVRNFSKGMKQRISIVCAIVHNPQVLFLDEPTSGLDIQSQRLIKNIITQMNQEGTTIFLTTHNIEEANLLCKRVGIINKGKIVTIDRPERMRKTFEATQSVEISFHKPFDEGFFEGQNLVNRMEKLGDKWKLYTDNPDRLVKYLVKLAHERDLIIISLEICRPSLEDVFVGFTEGTSHANQR